MPLEVATPTIHVPSPVNTPEMIDFAAALAAFDKELSIDGAYDGPVHIEMRQDDFDYGYGFPHYDMADDALDEGDEDDDYDEEDDDNEDYFDDEDDDDDDEEEDEDGTRYTY